jgi:hypothetical protein
MGSREGMGRMGCVLLHWAARIRGFVATVFLLFFLDPTTAYRKSHAHRSGLVCPCDHGSGASIDATAVLRCETCSPRPPCCGGGSLQGPWILSLVASHAPSIRRYLGLGRAPAFCYRGPGCGFTHAISPGTHARLNAPRRLVTMG